MRRDGIEYNTWLIMAKLSLWNQKVIWYMASIPDYKLLNEPWWLQTVKITRGFQPTKRLNFRWKHPPVPPGTSLNDWVLKNDVRFLFFDEAMLLALLLPESVLRYTLTKNKHVFFWLNESCFSMILVPPPARDGHLEQKNTPRSSRIWGQEDVPWILLGGKEK